MLRELFARDGVLASVRPSERFADHLVFRSRPALPNRGAVALVGHLDTVFPPGTFEGYRSDDSMALRSRRARHEGRARRHRVRAPGPGGNRRARCRGPGSNRRRRRRRGGLAGGSGCHRRGDQRVERVPRLRGGPRGRRDHHAPQGHGRDDRDRPWPRGARGQRPRRRRERHLGRRPVRRRGSASDRLRPGDHGERRAHRRGPQQEHGSRPGRGAARPALPDADRRRAARRSRSVAPPKTRPRPCRERASSYPEASRAGPLERTEASARLCAEYARVRTRARPRVRTRLRSSAAAATRARPPRSGSPRSTASGRAARGFTRRTSGSSCRRSSPRRRPSPDSSPSARSADGRCAVRGSAFARRSARRWARRSAPRAARRET